MSAHVERQCNGVCGGRIEDWNGIMWSVRRNGMRCMEQDYSVVGDGGGDAGVGGVG